ncbi:MAG TPA: electron transfer flavoprotein subunit alpha/FixB family protein [Gemmatimonadaceae bacterium]|nr:electron transfer flavoprotein subunit alpha/FixB family protein [Gemmatimonadaceae bacterium]
MAHVLVFAESRGGAPRKVALETMTAARTLADAAGGEVHAILAGPPGIGAHAASLGEYGADRVLLIEHEALSRYDAESLTATVAARAGDGAYRAVVCTASAQGRDLAPRVAAALGAPIASDVVSVELDGDVLRVRHPAYTGKLVATLAVRGSPVVVSVRPNAFSAHAAPKAGTVEALALAADPGASRAKVVEMVEGARDRLDLADAPVVVSGGRGLRAPENFALLEELAAAFGGTAAVGATRAVTDDGWRPHSDQIGQTGRLVSPDLYIAIGISGAIQHVAGMRTSRTIVAINKDKDAPIFKIADYGIVGDALEVVPALTSEIRSARGTG